MAASYTIFALWTPAFVTRCEDPEDRQAIGFCREKLALGRIFLACAWITNFYFIYQQVRLIRHAGLMNMMKRGLWDNLDMLLTTTLLVLPAVVIFGEPNEIIELVAITSLLVYAKLLYFMRGFNKLSFLISMIVDIMISLRSFLFVMVVVMWGFAVSFFVSDNNFRFNSLSDSLWHVFNLVFGMTSLDDRSWVAVAAGTLYMVLIVILFLNILIAVISDGFERVMERSALSTRYEKASIITEIEVLMSEAELNNPDLFPLWIHALVPKENLGQQTNWQGRMWAMKQHISMEMEKTRAQMTADLHEVVGSCDNLLEKIEELNNSVEASTSTTLQKINANAAQVTKFLSSVSMGMLDVSGGKPESKAALEDEGPSEEEGEEEEEEEE